MTRGYLVIPEGMAREVRATSPFNAATEAREDHPELRGRPITVVASSRAWRFEGKRWFK